MIGRLIFLLLIFKILDVMFGWSHSFKKKKDNEGKHDFDIDLGHENNRRAITRLAIVLALPIPISVLTWIPTIMSLAGEGSFSDFFTSIGSFLFLLTMILSGAYLFTYLFAIGRTRKARKISWISYLPMWQIIAVIILIFLTSILQSYGL